MEPADKILDVVPKGTNYDLVQYYTKCIGSNPLASTLKTAKASVWDAESRLQTSPCQGDPKILDAIASLGVVETSLDDISCSLSCDSISPAWYGAVNQGICTDAFTGTYALKYINWIARTCYNE
jgi:hypothetical protein